MIYLTYDEYKDVGGVLDLTAFERYVVRASGIITNATFNRMEHMTKIPDEVKILCRELTEYLVNNVTSDAVVTSKSQSAGAVSESESYLIKTKEEQAQDINNLIYDYLAGISDDNGTPLLYKGCLG